MLVQRWVKLTLANHKLAWSLGSLVDAFGLSGILFDKQKIGRSYDFNKQDTINFIEYLYNVQGLRCSKWQVWKFKTKYQIIVKIFKFWGWFWSTKVISLRMHLVAVEHFQSTEFDGFAQRFRITQNILKYSITKNW